MPIISNDKCKAMFIKGGRQEYIPDIFMCAGYEDGKQDSCQVPIIYLTKKMSRGRGSGLPPHDQGRTQGLYYLTIIK